MRGVSTLRCRHSFDPPRKKAKALPLKRRVATDKTAVGLSRPVGGLPLTFWLVSSVSQSNLLCRKHSSDYRVPTEVVHGNLCGRIVRLHRVSGRWILFVGGRKYNAETQLPLRAKFSHHGFRRYALRRRK